MNHQERPPQGQLPQGQPPYSYPPYSYPPYSYPPYSYPQDQYAYPPQGQPPYSYPQDQYLYPPQGQYAYPPQPPHSKTSGFAVTALVTGIVGLVFSWVPLLDLVLAIVAVTFGALGWHYASTRGQAGKGMAIAGLVMGILTAVLFVIFLFTFR